MQQHVLAFLAARGEIPGATVAEQLAYDYLDAGLVDSMGIVEMVMNFEQTFGIRFEPKHLQSSEMRTVGGLIELVSQLRSNGNQP